MKKNPQMKKKTKMNKNPHVKKKLYEEKTQMKKHK